MVVMTWICMGLMLVGLVGLGFSYSWTIKSFRKQKNIDSRGKRVIRKS